MLNFRFILLLLLCLPVLAAAQSRTWQRTYPSDSAAALMSNLANGVAKLDGEEIKVSLALQIRNADNLIITPSMMPDATIVRYQKDSEGNLWRVWILSDSEKIPSLSGNKKIPPVLN